MTLNENYSFETGIYLEERSYSGGNNTLANLVVFPKILISAKERFANNKYTLRIKGGDFWNEDIDDILRIYNIDYQGLFTEISNDKFSMGFLTIGDLSRNIGLDLHQLYKFHISYDLTKFKNNLSLTVNELIDQPRGMHLTKIDKVLSNYAKYMISDRSVMEGQIDIRFQSGVPASLASAVRFKTKIKQLEFSSSIRYYSFNFNHGYNGELPRYYWSEGSYVGPQLYPMKNFYRTLSQWALYSHNQSNYMLAIELTGSWAKRIHKKIFSFCDFDINVLHNLKKNDVKIFPIYNLGIKQQFLKKFNGSVSLTNKHMELRDFYQTASISTWPYLALGVTMELNQLKLNRPDRIHPNTQRMIRQN